VKKARLLTILAITAIALGSALYLERVRISDWFRQASAPELPEAVTYEEVAEEEESEGAEEPEGTEEPEGIEVVEEEEVPVTEEAIVAEADDDFPAEFNLAVPFTSQAPFSNWDEVHEETCEEASVYMVHMYYEGEPEGQIDPSAAEAELMRIVDFENALFGFYKDTTAEQTAIFTEQLYGYERVDVLQDPTAEEIKAHVAAGRPVIIPAAGRLLGNPYFSGIGPIYHMVVVRGYTDETFITNDPGTRRGEEYVYDIDTLMFAMHDWNGGDVTNGAKVAIVIYPN